MNPHWIDTQAIYHQIIDAPDVATRSQRYQDLIIQPWQAMMANMAGMFNSDPNDPFGVARAWGWLLPQDLAEPPSSLRILEHGDAWRIGKAALETGAAQWTRYADRLPIDTVTGWLILSDPARLNPWDPGYTGAIDWTTPQLVVQYAAPTQDNLRHLPGAIVHEMHHLIRLRIFPWNMTATSVAEYIVHEGLAESFAADLFGEAVVGPYVTALEGDDLKSARRLIGEGLDRTGFDVIRGYIFGDEVMGRWGGGQSIGMPNFGGYAVGYRVVQAFLRRTGMTVAEATFLPAAEIVQEAAYF